MSYSPPPGFTLLHETRFGTAWYIRSNGPGMEPDYLMVQDTEAVLDRNVAMQNHNDGWSIGGSKIDKALRRVATVPWVIQEKWRQEHGVDYNSIDPDMQRKVDQMLDSSDWRKLRTSTFRIGTQSRWM